jgi:hypothetical protein
MYKAIIAGGRNFIPNIEDEKWLINIIKENHINTILCGMAHGADEFGFKIAKKLKLNIDEYPAKWQDFDTKPCLIKTSPYGYRYNALAGINRNEIMAQNADICVLFPGKTGTNDMKNRAIAHGLKIIQRQFYE